MTLTADLLAGIPPFGKGLYARDTIERGSWDFVAVQAWRSDRGSQVAAVRAQGAVPWLYGTPERFGPGEWRASLVYIVAECERLGCAGVIVDPENRWTNADGAEAAEFGAACAAAARRVRVGCTSFPEWPGLAAFAGAAGRAVWGSPQIYGRTTGDPAVFRRWLDRWRAAFGPRIAISGAAWQSSERLSTPEGYASYLASLPASAGVIFWDAAGAAPAFILDALDTFRPKDGVRSRAEVLAAHPPFVGALALAVVAAAVLASKGAR